VAQRLWRRSRRTEDGLSITRVYHAFETTDQFEEVLERHLRKLAVQIIEERES
jgi:hypothetical protein